MEMNVLLERVNHLKAEVDALRPIDAAQERRIMQKFRLDWTFHSNAIEGNRLTYGETRAFLLHGITAQGKPFRDYLDIKGHHEAIDFLLAVVRQDEPLTEADVRELHKVILVEPYQVDARTLEGQLTKRTIQPGQYKTMPNHVETSTGEIHYYAMPEDTPAKMADLMAWYRRELDKGDLHPLKLAATFHYEFVRIHPFDDGNGRMARLLMNLIFMQAGFPPVVVRTEDKNNYLLALELADTGDLEPFIVHIGNELLNSLDLFLRGAKGEPIEGEDDLDKKLTLLEYKAEAVKKAKGPEKNPAVLSLFFDVTLSRILTQIFTQLPKFNRFFSSRSFRFEFNDSQLQHELFSLEDSEKTIRYFKQVMTNRDIEYIQITYEWKELLADKQFGLTIKTSIFLRQWNFEMMYHPSDHTKVNTFFSGGYTDFFSDEQIKTSISNLTDDVYKQIDEVISDKNKNS
ncbi:Fic family protein [Candidatus Leptofilum sp.]|uniref:Fic family protein n=1 Tax=Candidatus Leptofilum sp. TaxID=3241576 RepID=UPI003B58BEE7